jgi:hypothetical protein
MERHAALGIPKPQHFPTKWKPVRRRKCHKSTAFFSDEVETGSSWKMRQTRNWERAPRAGTRRASQQQNVVIASP